jgi:ribosome assembly protein 4
MATIVPPPSKRQRREELERSQIQQDVTAVAAADLGSFKARFVDSDGNQMTDVVEIPLGDATEKNVSLLLNTLLGRVSSLVLPTPSSQYLTYPIAGPR